MSTQRGCTLATNSTPPPPESRDIPIKGHSICLVCAGVVVVEPEVEEEEECPLEKGKREEESDGEGDDDEDVAIWNFFVKLFRLGGKRRLKWELEEGERVPLCSSCKDELAPLLELQLRVDQLLEGIEAGSLELKETMRDHEGDFREGGVYGKDERFYLARLHILGKQIVYKCKHPESRRTTDNNETGENYSKKGAQRGRRRPISSHHPSRRKTTKEEDEEKKDFATTAKTVLKIVVKTEQEVKEEEEQEEEETIGFPNLGDIGSSSSGGGDETPPPPSPVPSTGVASVELSGGDDDDEWVPPPPPKSGEKSSSDSDSDESIMGKGKPKSRKSLERVGGARKRRGRSGSPPEEQEESPKRQRRKPKKGDKDDNNMIGNVESGQGDKDDDDDLRATFNRGRFYRSTGTFTCRNIRMEKVGEDQYKCRKCSEVVDITTTPNHQSVYNNKCKLLQNHIFWKHSTLTTCPVCGQVCPSIDSIKRHMSSEHRGITPLQLPPSAVVNVIGWYRRVACPVCGKMVQKSPTKLRAHLWSHYSAEEKREAIRTGKSTVLPPRQEKRKCQCQHCGRILSGANALKRHVLSFHSSPEDEPGPGALKKPCPECGLPFVRLKRHMTRIHGSNAKNKNPKKPERQQRRSLKPKKRKSKSSIVVDDDYSTNLCHIFNRGVLDPVSGAFTCRDIRMEKVAGEDDQYRCSECSELLVDSNKSNKVHLRNHIFWKHSTLTTCSLCGEVTPSIDRLRSHTHTAHEQSPLPIPSYATRYGRKPCPICGRMVRTSAKYLRNHLWTHKSAEEKREAIQAGRGVSYRGLSKPGRVRVRKVPSVGAEKKGVGRGGPKCPECGRQMHSNHTLKQHMLAIHPPPTGGGKPKKMCPECGLTFVKLNDHIARMHTAKDPDREQRFVCDECGKVLGTRDGLTAHKWKHATPFPCAECGWRFGSPGNLRRHIKAKHKDSQTAT